MNEEKEKENPPPLDKNAYLAKIERLYIEGRRTREIAVNAVCDTAWNCYAGLDARRLSARH